MGINATLKTYSQLSLAVLLGLNIKEGAYVARLKNALFVYEG
jgi:hypothetical protein